MKSIIKIAYGVVASGILLAVSTASAYAACTNVDTSKGLLTTAYEVTTDNEVVSGEVDGSGCNIGVYISEEYSGVTVTADVHDSNNYGIFNNGNVFIEDSEIYNIGNHVGTNYNPNGVQTGIAIYFFDATGSIKNSHIHDYQKGGIAINGVSEANVSGNVIGGFDSVSFIAQNGIQFGYGATGEVLRNEVSGNWYTGAGWSSTGILLFETSNVTVSQNKIYDNQVGIGIETWYWYVQSASDNLLFNNHIYNSDWGITAWAYDLTGLYGPGYSKGDALLENNKIVNNHLDSADGNTGISVGAYTWDDTYLPQANDNVVKNNKVKGFETPYEGVEGGNNKVISGPNGPFGQGAGVYW